MHDQVLAVLVVLGVVDVVADVMQYGGGFKELSPNGCPELGRAQLRHLVENVQGQFGDMFTVLDFIVAKRRELSSALNSIAMSNRCSRELREFLSNHRQEQSIAYAAVVNAQRIHTKMTH